MNKIINCGHRLVLLMFMMLISIDMTPKTISVKGVGKSAEQVFIQIMKQTDHEYIYSAGIFTGKSSERNISAPTLREALDQLLTPLGISYKIKGKKVILSKGKGIGKETRFVTVSGYVREADTGEALIGATVRDSLSRYGSFTNASGFYTFSVPAGKVNLIASFLGNGTESHSLDATKNVTVDFQLPRASELHEIIVTADKNRTIALESTDLGKYNLSGSMIARTPVIFGESDVIKTLQLTPGVSAGTEGLAGMNVQGGDNDENLFMIDNVPLYQVNHFGGLFSAFNIGAIKDVNFYKSTFPAKYDGRLSSVLDVHTKDGSLTRWHGSVRLGLTSGAVNADGPIIKDKTSLSVAMRRSWYDILTIPAMAIFNKVREKFDNYTEKTIFGYTFTDFNAKINHHFSRKSQMHLMFYYGEDYLKYGWGEDYTVEKDSKKIISEEYRDISKLHWGNIVTSLGWNYSISDRMYMELTGSFSKYFSKISRDYSEKTEMDTDEPQFNTTNRTDRNSITDWSLRADFSYTPGHTNRISFGGDIVYHNFIPEKINRTLIDNEASFTSASSLAGMNALQFGLYAGDDIDISEAVKASAGVHFNIFSISGKTYTNLDPRLSVRWKVTPWLSLKTGYSRMAQYIHQLTTSAISLPTDQWVPVSGSLRPQVSDKVAAGVFFNIADRYTFSLEGYWKRSRNIVDYKDDYFLYPLDAPWDQKLCLGKGYSKGLDFMVEKTSGKFTGHIAYSLLFSDRQFAEKNDGLKFPSRYDNRHKFNIMLNWRINDKWEINAAWTGMSGNMFTLSLQNYELVNDPSFHYPSTDSDIIYEGAVDLVGRTNNLRLPFYHRMDLGVNRYTRHGFWNFSFYNAYCHINVIAIRKSMSTFDDEKPCYKALRLLPIIPSVSYTWLF